jgi:TRAP-type transport system periplasmic protein
MKGIQRPTSDKTSRQRVPRYGLLRTLAVAATGALLLAACAADDDEPDVAEPDEPEEVEPTTLTLGHIRTTDDPFHEGAERFAELVEEKTGGAYVVEVFPNAELGGTVDMFSGMQAGTIDMMYSGITAYPFVEGAEVFNITAMPFLWRDHDSMQEVLDSDLFAEFFEEAAQNTQVRALAVRGEAETRELSSNVPVQAAEDFQGLQIRTAESPMTIAAFTTLGAVPTVIDFPDLYLSLAQGVVDAQENGFSTIRSASFYEVQDYLIPIHYIREIVTVFISEQLYQELSPEHQQAFREAGIEAGDHMTELMQTKLDEDFNYLSERMEVLDPDLDSIRDALEGAFDEFDGDLWPEGLEAQVREAQGL